jgi:hypothetical protein
MGGVEDKKYKHGEAFCLMRYKCKSCCVMETLWNSRDGVTPFVISCRKCAGEMQHVDWHADDCRPDYLPKKGMRVFVDLTPQINEVLWRSVVHQFWLHKDYPMSKQWDAPMEAVKELSKDLQDGEPYIITV